MTLKTCRFLIVLAFALSFGLQVMAEEAPDIQIRYGDDETILEYRVKGKLVEIKVVPKIGPVYYLIPTDSGDFERSATSRIVFPSWKLLEW